MRIQNTITTVVAPTVSASRRERDLLELTAHTVDEFSNRGDQSLKHGYNPLLELHGHLIDQNQPAPVYALIHLQGLGRGTRI
jgi:hypothetical protein